MRLWRELDGAVLRGVDGNGAVSDRAPKDRRKTPIASVTLEVLTPAANMPAIQSSIEFPFIRRMKVPPNPGSTRSVQDRV
jgi:hypothetical protein